MPPPIKRNPIPGLIRLRHQQQTKTKPSYLNSLSGKNTVKKIQEVIEKLKELGFKDNIKSANEYFKIIYNINLQEGGRKKRGGGIEDFGELPDDFNEGENALIYTSIEYSGYALSLAENYTSESGGQQIIGSSVKAGINFVYLLDSIFKFSLTLTRLPISALGSTFGVFTQLFNILKSKTETLITWMEDPEIQTEIAKTITQYPESVLFIILGLNQAGLLPLVTITSIILSYVSFQLSPAGRIALIYEIFIWYVSSPANNRQYIVQSLMGTLNKPNTTLPVPAVNINLGNSVPVQNIQPLNPPTNTNSQGYLQYFKNAISGIYNKAINSAKLIDKNLPNQTLDKISAETLEQAIKDPLVNMVAVNDITLIKDNTNNIKDLNDTELIKKLREYRDKQKQNKPITEQQISELNEISNKNFFIKGLIAKIQRENVNISQPTNTGSNTMVVENNITERPLTTTNIPSQQKNTNTTDDMTDDTQETNTNIPPPGRPKRGKGRRLTKRVKNQKRRQTRKH